jgi:hypothetical protein
MPFVLARIALLGSISSGFGAAQAEAAPAAVDYSCRANQQLSVQRDSSRARVSLGGRTFDLQRRRSSIGEKYLSPTAALIIDGASAVFVSNDHLDLGICFEGASVATTG